LSLRAFASHCTLRAIWTIGTQGAFGTDFTFLAILTVLTVFAITSRLAGFTRWALLALRADSTLRTDGAFITGRTSSAVPPFRSSITALSAGTNDRLSRQFDAGGTGAARDAWSACLARSTELSWRACFATGTFAAFGTEWADAPGDARDTGKARAATGTKRALLATPAKIAADALDATHAFRTRFASLASCAIASWEAGNAYHTSIAHFSRLTSRAVLAHVSLRTL